MVFLVSIQILKPITIDSSKLSSASYCIFAPSPNNLILYTSGGENLIYTWYKLPSDSISPQNGSILANTNSNSYTPSTQNISLSKYYAVITSGNSSCVAKTSDISGVISILNGISTPTLAQFNDTSFCKNALTNNLNIRLNTLTDNSIINWYRSNNNLGVRTNDRIITVNGSQALILNTDSAGVFYYYAVIKFSSQVSGCNVDSIITDYSGKLAIYERPTVPINTTNRINYCLSSIPNLIAVNPVVNGGPTNYRYTWFSLIDSNINAINQYSIQNSNTNAILPKTDTIGVKYYYAIVQNGVAGCTGTSNLSGGIRVTSTQMVEIEAINKINNNINNDTLLCSNILNGGYRLSANIINTDYVSTYQWYRVLTNIKWGFKWGVDRGCKYIGIYNTQ